MKVIYSSPTAWWVPFALLVFIVGGTWFGAVWNDENVGDATRLSVGLLVVLLIVFALHGRLFWRGQVSELTTDGQTYHAKLTAWVGPGRKVSFTAADITDWTSTPRSVRKPGEPPALGTLYFTARGERLELSFVDPKVVDVAGLTAINPGYFAKVIADYPALKSLPA